MAYKDRVVAYYHEFKKQINERYTSDDVKPNIAMTFSFGNDHDPDSTPIEVIEEMFNDYADFTGIKFLPGDKIRGENAYFEDLTVRAKRGGRGRNPKNIDILIVADQLLTGYDSKRINTLYVDRHLELQGLIQAYSRTNRVFGSNKEFGTIINFQFPRTTEESVNEALLLYGSGGSSSSVLVEKYEDAVKMLRSTFESLISELPDPKSRWSTIMNDEEKKESFKKAFKEASNQLNRVKQYYEFTWDDDNFGFSERIWLQYLGAYKNLFPREIESVIIGVESLKGRTKLQGTQVIDAQSLFALIDKKTTNKDGVIVINDNNLVLILEQIQELSDLGENELAESLETFINEELVTGHLPVSVDFDTAFKEWQEKRQDSVVEKFAIEWGIDSKLLKKSLNEYNVKKPDEIPFRDEIAKTIDPDIATNNFSGSKLKLNMELNKVLSSWMQEVKMRYR